jgi:hypothetical protein
MSILRAIVVFCLLGIVGMVQVEECQGAPQFIGM